MVKVFSVEVSDSLGGEIAVVRPQRLVYIESFPITLLSPLFKPFTRDISIVWGEGEGQSIARGIFQLSRQEQEFLSVSILSF